MLMMTMKKLLNLLRAVQWVDDDSDVVVDDENGNEEYDGDNDYNEETGPPPQAVQLGDA